MVLRDVAHAILRQEELARNAAEDEEVVNACLERMMARIEQ